MNELPVVRVATADGGYMVINESDYDPAVHELLPLADAAIASFTLELAAVEKLIANNTVTQLKAIAKEKNIKGYSRMNEQQLAEAIAADEL